MKTSTAAAILSPLVALVLALGLAAGVVAAQPAEGTQSPAEGVWRPVSQTGAPAPRTGSRAIWTGTEMLIWGGRTAGDLEHGETLLADGARYRPPAVAPRAAPEPAPPLARDERYFAETGFRVERDDLWAYFQARGGIDTFGFPVSRTFTFLGCPVQVFQRQVAQACPGQGVQLLNLLDPELFPYTRVNGSTFPAPDEGLKNQTPRVGSVSYVPDILAFIGTNVPDTFAGEPVRFAATFMSPVTPEEAGSASPRALGLANLEVWGAPVSRPMRDPNNPNFVYQRFQRGIMHYIKGQGTRGILLADYFKSVLLGPTLAPAYGASLPEDLAQQAQGSRFFAQYCPGAPNWLCRPNELPATDLTFAFEPG